MKASLSCLDYARSASSCCTPSTLMYTKLQQQSQKEGETTNSLLDPGSQLELCSIFKPLTSSLTFDQAGE